MQPTDHTLKLTRQRRPGVALLAVLFALALEPQGGGRAEAALATVGPVDPATGFPVDYADGNGRALQICLDAGVCTAPLPNPNLPPSVPSNFPDETFYWSGGATMTTNANGTALLFMAVEAAFGNGVATAPADHLRPHSRPGRQPRRRANVHRDAPLRPRQLRGAGDGR